MFDRHNSKPTKRASVSEMRSELVLPLECKPMPSAKGWKSIAQRILVKSGTTAAVRMGAQSRPVTALRMKIKLWKPRIHSCLVTMSTYPALSTPKSWLRISTRTSWTLVKKNLTSGHTRA